MAIYSEKCSKNRVKCTRISMCYLYKAQLLKRFMMFAFRYVFGPTWGDPDLMAKAHSKAIQCQRNQCTCCFDIFTIKVQETRETQNSPRKGRAQVVSVN